MPKVGDIVFAKTHDVYSGEDSVSAALVTRVFTEEDGAWAKDREILGLTIFPHNAAPTYVDMDKGTVDDDGEWVAGGWSDSEDGPSSASSATVDEPESVPFNPTPAALPDGSTGNPGSVGDETPSSVSGASTDTSGDGSDAAPVNQPV